MKNNYLDFFGGNEIELFGIEMNEKECSRSVPIRYVPLHRKDRY
jgi:hypothetical protein